MTEKTPSPIRRFAHLVGLGGPSATIVATAAKAEGDDGDERDKKDDETDEEHAARVKALDDEQEKKDEEEAKAAATAKAKAEDGDDDSDKEDDKDSAKKAARLRERARCAAIFDAATPATMELAATLAFGPSNLSRDAAAGLLKASAALLPSVTATALAPAAPTSRTGTLDARMGKVAVPVIGPDAANAPGADTPAALAAKMIANSARGMQPQR